MKSEQIALPLVYKANELIEGKYALTTVAQKIAAGVLSKVNPTDDSALPTFSLTLKELSTISGVSEGVLRNKLSSYTHELKAVVIELRKVGQLSYQQVSLFRKFAYDDDTRALKVIFEDEMEQYIRNFSGNFTKYQISQIQKLKSSYAVRLYEIMRMVYNRHKRKATPVYSISVAELKKMLGISDNSYKHPSDLRRRVLDLAKKELKEKSDIYFEFEFVRTGRSVTDIRFEIFPNPKFCQKSGKRLAITSNDGLLEIVENDDIQLDAVPTYSAPVQSVKNMFPELTDDALGMLSLYPDQVIMTAMLTFLGSDLERVKNRLAYFKKILDSKYAEAKEASPKKKSKSTKEKLTDRSWAEGLLFEEG